MEKLIKDLEVHSVALVHPNFAYGKTPMTSLFSLAYIAQTRAVVKNMRTRK